MVNRCPSMSPGRRAATSRSSVATLDHSLLGGFRRDPRLTVGPDGAVSRNRRDGAETKRPGLASGGGPDLRLRRSLAGPPDRRSTPAGPQPEAPPGTG